MPTLSLAKSRNPKSAARKRGGAKPHAASRRKIPPTSAGAKTPPWSVVSKTGQVAAAKTPVTVDESGAERVTKQECMLSLLSQPEGASIKEMMQATNWQEHSVRGFLAGTVKKKLGFLLTSAKSDDGIRRYCIKPRRAR